MTCVTSTGLISLDTLENGCMENVQLIRNFVCVSTTCNGKFKRAWRILLFNHSTCYYICTTTRPISTNLGRVVTYHERLSHVKPDGPARPRDKLKPLSLHYHNAYGHEAWQIGNSEGLSTINSYDYLVMCFCEISSKLKKLYFHCHNAKGHQTWQTADLLWGFPTQKVT